MDPKFKLIKKGQSGPDHFVTGMPYTSVVMVALAFDPNGEKAMDQEHEGHKLTSVSMMEVNRDLNLAVAKVLERYGVDWISPVCVAIGNGPTDGNYIGQFNPQLSEEERQVRQKRIVQIVEDIKLNRDPAERVLAGMQEDGFRGGNYA